MFYPYPFEERVNTPDLAGVDDAGADAIPDADGAVGRLADADDDDQEDERQDQAVFDGGRATRLMPKVGKGHPMAQQLRDSQLHRENGLSVRA